VATITATEATRLVTDSLGGALGAEDASIVADHLVDASLRGYPEFGVLRVLELVDAVRVRTPGDIAVVFELASSALLDGADNIGYVVARRATQLAIDKALAHGVAVVGAHHTYFTGLLAHYAEMAAQHGLASIITSSGEPLVAPFGGTRARLGTNPIAIGVPGDRPVIWDIGTSSITRGDVWRRARSGRPLPDGLAVDADGAPTVDAAAALQGALLPWGGHRGAGLSLMVQLLGLMAGASPATDRSVGTANGFLVIAIDPEVLGGRDELAEAVRTFTDDLLAAGDAGHVRLPFERSVETRQRSLRDGFEVEDAALAELRQIAQDQAAVHRPDNTRTRSARG
jgi:LDH2 family malate/lactate/ureidoglycolate dehydrogenase